ncbi:MAG TPA: MBOAT family protein, partial [Verrucomicrobiae bacterium]|nr:MBOAT family protein [Verrucomicrobiae bacterium]
LAVWFARGRLVSWAFMWLMALAIFAGCKWLTFRMATFPAREFGWQRKLGFWLAWPGMNAAEFLGERRAEKRPSPHEWRLAAGKIILGSALLWVGARLWLPAHPVGAGWTGMVGIIFILHFGLFQLLSLGWRRHGVVAAPMMQNPLAATSLAEFWGCRWNTAFHHLAFRFAFRPLLRVARPEMATLGVFGLSGLLHELVISLPAGAGYGGPTIYFLVQGAGVVVERTRWGRRFELGRGVGGWIFTLLTTAVPVGLLFPPPFINNVIVPMLAAIGAT